METPTWATRRRYTYYFFAVGAARRVPYLVWLLLGFTLHTYYERKF